MRRSSAPPHPGEELKKSTHTELSTKIKRDFCALDKWSVVIAAFHP
jgi:hypothetical protein